LKAIKKQLAKIAEMTGMKIVEEEVVLLKKKMGRSKKATR
jgi:hypothetical protein